jgi:hypothetical protein
MMDTRVPATPKASPGSDRSGRRSFSEAGKPAYGNGVGGQGNRTAQ